MDFSLVELFFALRAALTNDFPFITPLNRLGMSSSRARRPDDLCLFTCSPISRHPNLPSAPSPFFPLLSHPSSRSILDLQPDTRSHYFSKTCSTSCLVHLGLPTDQLVLFGDPLSPIFSFSPFPHRVKPLLFLVHLAPAPILLSYVYLTTLPLSFSPPPPTSPFLLSTPPLFLSFSPQNEYCTTITHAHLSQFEKRVNVKKGGSTLGVGHRSIRRSRRL